MTTSGDRVEARPGSPQQPAPPRRRGRPAASGGPSTEASILRSAREVFAESGYEGATFAEIAARAGVTRPAVNHYFAGKPALYAAVFEATQDGVVTVGLARAAEATTSTERLGLFLETAAQADAGDRSFARFIAASLVDAFRHPELADHARRQIDDVRTFVRGTLETGMAAGEIRDDLELEPVTELLVAVMWGMGLYAGFVGTHDQLEAVVAQFERVLESVLVPSAPG
ncbi:TetR/AcrR family transcriptional regulator [Actinomycetospora sp.]|uniref:TetR/AcrR family transcriptional regulator n=1 Tax=Actinomycetospora sp. TaxID=1872135 RepID=UPI002F416CF4